MDHDADLNGPQDNVPAWTDGYSDAAIEPGAFFHAAMIHRAASPVQVRADSRFLDPYTEGQEDERLRVGRELHDSTGQLLLALRLSVAHLRHEQGVGDTEEILSEIDDTVRQIDQEIRTFSFLNCSADLGQCGLVGTLETLARGFGMRTGLRIGFQGSCQQPCTGQLGLALLRVAQEALMNVHRHAQATSVRMTLVEHDGLLELSVRDDGRGMPPVDSRSVANGVGLQSMRYRVERLGGRFNIRRLKHGTKLVASVPRIRPSALKVA